MGRRSESVPPSSAKSSTVEAGEAKKKSFVRVARSKTKSRAASEVRESQAVEPEVLDAEIVDDKSPSPMSASSSYEDGSEGDWQEADEPSHAIAPYEGSDILDVTVPDDSELEAGQSLVPSSALSRYLAELRRYPLLTPEEERRLATDAFENNNAEARQRLVTANLRLVVKIAMEYRRAYAQMLDLIQEGNAGLVQAVNRFNPYRGVKLSTYSAWWIRAYILKFLMDNKSLVRIGTTDAQRKLFFRLRSEAEKMYALTQRFDARLLADKIGVKESEVVEMNQRLSKGDVSLDTPVYDDQPGTRQMDLMMDESEAVDEKLAREQLLALLREQAEHIEGALNERDLFIFHHRILAEEPVTLQDVGDKFGITRERARQLEAKVVRKIKERLEEVGIDSF
jgi:RNA polymerase sigma-32 factor